MPTSTWPAPWPQDDQPDPRQYMPCPQMQRRKPRFNLIYYFLWCATYPAARPTLLTRNLPCWRATFPAPATLMRDLPYWRAITHAWTWPELSLAAPNSSWIKENTTCIQPLRFQIVTDNLLCILSPLFPILFVYHLNFIKYDLCADAHHTLKIKKWTKNDATSNF